MTIETPVLDRIDRRIIGILQTDGRISWRELADRVHLAPSSVADRVRRLEQTGVIRGYAASLDPRALGHDVRAVVDVALPPGTDPAEFEATLAQRDEVALAMYVTGPADYTIIVDCAGAEGLDAFIRWLKADAGVARTESKFVLRPITI
ncbi:MAG: Lrp/AsnC family transcriptional regulator [Actinobacteria bacterium]|nr:Lrp/AsnC family transcriptional regulator [Acidimicrobiaceae bacterium]MBP7890442.1 Lrp/AsnC family transcriptional regulator [Ilumatobacteraceae bacterium]NMD25298.1 Lrp/AsnC family transcriptional regulator [Actinomycetota bacterium]MBP8212009.1 Lrp/AsnC family transcriptional regulator [Ilumatobacteraceae bacterium]MBP9052166.1 Lrp/AsnC family transcriptional regulator [Ilumatobacteraceae bacterium]